ncbi:MAG: 4-(cytidine 5'-diphospho)-2-C-methyl-D-erythritol kinase [Crocinitomix sp.]|nr:4-(cytidine 5'-diphospho)-2-C-methyl-D-erythritol kinase [Crocinitomix sp.]
MVIFPGCKINIGLNITGKRPDGYHKIESIFYPLELSDILEIVPNKNFSINITGLSIKGDPEDNLIFKAYSLLKVKYNLPPVKIHLHKVVPMGAGLGGGSADGAATLILLNDLFDLKIKNEQLELYADSLGSDCAFFIRNTPAYVKGKGEIIHPIEVNLKGKYIYLINPQIHISTSEAFAGIVPTQQKLNVKECIGQDQKSWQTNIKNDFETTIFPNYPTLAEIKKKLYSNGALYASMTGTGSSVYGIFNKKPALLYPDYFEWISIL